MTRPRKSKKAPRYSEEDNTDWVDETAQAEEEDDEEEVMEEEYGEE
jgi:hypothetical protein